MQMCTRLLAVVSPECRARNKPHLSMVQTSYPRVRRYIL